MINCERIISVGCVRMKFSCVKLPEKLKYFILFSFVMKKDSKGYDFENVFHYDCVNIVA